MSLLAFVRLDDVILFFRLADLSSGMTRVSFDFIHVMVTSLYLGLVAAPWLHIGDFDSLISAWR
jgi:hypothetical protein